ncbi:MAG: AsmA family protein [Candidatus Scalindua sp.]|nr:AsmA family protein [Candidatus Scalindua sp.]
MTLETRPKKRRWPVITGISVGAVFGITGILVLLIPTFVSTDMAKSRIIRAMETNLGRKVEVDDIRMSWSDGVDVRNILIKEREGIPGDAFIKVDRFYCDIQFFPLIRKQIRIRELIIDNPEVVVHRYKQTVSDGESTTPESKQPSVTERVRVPEVAEQPVENDALSALALPFVLDIELKAKINNGTFTFVDHRLREKTVIHDFNTTLNIESLDKPIELKTAFDIETKGKTEHADISLDVSLSKDGEVNPRYARGAFKAETGFAKATADFDMASFSGEGGQGFEFISDIDTKGLTEKLAGILGLPEGLQVEGVCSSKITARGSLDKLINVDGRTDFVNLNVSGGPFKDKPVKDLNIKLLQSADVDVVNDRIQIYRFSLESLFAEMGITGLVTDLRSAGNLDLKMFFQCDIAGMAGALGGLLPLDGEIAGKVQSNVTLQGQRNKPRIDGKTVIKDLFLKKESFGPITEPEILITHNATLDAFDKSIIIREMGLSTSFVEFGSSGSLNHEKEADVNVILSVKNLEKLVGSLAGIVPLPQGFTVSGKTTTEMKIKGSREKGVRISGNTVLEGVNVAGGPLEKARISNLNMELVHVLDHSMPKDEVKIEQLDIDSDFLTMRSKGGAKNLSDDMDVDYGASLNLNLEKSTTLFSDFFPAGMSMAGKGIVDFTLRGKLPVDDAMYDDLVFQGNMFMEKVEYISNNITDLKAQFRLDNGIFNTDGFTFDLNDGEGKISAKAILSEEQPSSEFRLDLMDVLINQKIDTLGKFIPNLSQHEGEVSGTLNMDIAAQGKGLNWQDELSRTLSAEGNISIKNGLIKGDKVLSRIISDESFKFEELTTPVRIKDGKIFTDDLQINGSKLDIGLSGWTAFDGRIEYTVESDVLARYIGGDAENILGMLGKGVHLPIIITGTVNKPKVALKLPKSKEGFGDLIEGIMGSIGKSKEGGKGSEGVDGAQGELKTGESSDEKKPEKSRTEEKVEKLLKSLFK